MEKNPLNFFSIRNCFLRFFYENLFLQDFFLRIFFRTFFKKRFMLKTLQPQFMAIIPIRHPTHTTPVEKMQTNNSIPHIGLTHDFRLNSTGVANKLDTHTSRSTFTYIRI